jgi:acyl dehydratase
VTSDSITADRALSDDELLEIWRQRIGTVAVPSLVDQPFCRNVNEDSIFNVCWAAGDLNPLWISEEYGRRSVFGRNIAPPYMVYALAPWTIHGGVFFGIRDAAGNRLPTPGASGVQGGVEFEWLRRLELGDRIECEARLVDVITHKSRTWGRTFELVAEFTLRDSRSEPVARARYSHLGTEHRDVQSPRVELEPRTWTPEEIEEVRAEYARQPEKIRGADVLFWEDVSEGEPLPVILKGPYTEASYIAHGTAFPLRNIHSTDEIYWNHVFEENIAVHTNRGLLGSNQLTRQGVPAGHRYHYDYDSAALRGLPAPIDVGNQRVISLIQLVTMWMGDHGLLRSLSARHRDVNMAGDLTHLTGTILEKSVEDGRHLVHCELVASTQRGPSTVGRCIVELVSRAAGPGAAPAGT